MEYRGGDPYAVTFLDSPGDYANVNNDGVCEGCHWDDKAAHIYEMEETPENDDCTSCHGTHCADTPNPGDPGMFSTGGGMPDDVSHKFHRFEGPYTDNPKMAVLLECDDCHPSGYEPLAETVASGVCDSCHSPDGAFDGLYDPDVGVSVQANWTNGIYEEDGVTLKEGKEKWCATCHDNVPAYSQAEVAVVPDPIVVDNADPEFALEPDVYWVLKTKGGAYPPGGSGTMYFRPGVPGDGSIKAVWSPSIAVEDAGNYRVYAWWIASDNRATDAKYTVFYGDPEVSMTFTVSQKTDGSQWNELTAISGPLPFPSPGSINYRVELSNDANGRIIADAIKFEKQ